MVMVTILVLIITNIKVYEITHLPYLSQCSSELLYSKGYIIIMNKCETQKHMLYILYELVTIKS